MKHLTTLTKITPFFEDAIKGVIESLHPLLLQGDLYKFEQDLTEAMKRVYNHISETLIKDASEELVPSLIQKAKSAGCLKIATRPVSIRLSTGHSIGVMSPYAKRVPAEWSGSRHMLERHWRIIGGASPGLYDRVGFCAAIGPSYDLAHQALKKFGVSICKSSVRDLSNRLADFCHQYGEENLVLGRGETLAGKRVVLSIDGGRTRTRLYNGKTNDAGRATYDTAWCEPKLFVIDVLDEQGRAARHELPVYGCRFSESDVLDLLKRFLRKLHIHKAQIVQLIADGAIWIWNNVKDVLRDLGVTNDRIIETLDYYHSSQYVHDVVQAMPKRITGQQRKKHLEEFKDWLWQGRADLIVKQCQEIFKRPGKLVTRWINYLDKHQAKTQYAEFEKNKLMCGSGIIESGIRRIINLRFKNTATFWEKEVVEKLFCLRAALLAKRWDLLMANLSQ